MTPEQGREFDAMSGALGGIRAAGGTDIQPLIQAMALLRESGLEVNQRNLEQIMRDPDFLAMVGGSAGGAPPSALTGMAGPGAEGAIAGAAGVGGGVGPAAGGPGVGPGGAPMATVSVGAPTPIPQPASRGSFRRYAPTKAPMPGPGAGGPSPQPMPPGGSLPPAGSVVGRISGPGRPAAPAPSEWDPAAAAYREQATGGAPNGLVQLMQTIGRTVGAPSGALRRAAAGEELPLGAELAHVLGEAPEAPSGWEAYDQQGLGADTLGAPLHAALGAGLQLADPLMALGLGGASRVPAAYENAVLRFLTEGAGRHGGSARGLHRGAREIYERMGMDPVQARYEAGMARATSRRPMSVQAAARYLRDKRRGMGGARGRAYNQAEDMDSSARQLLLEDLYNERAQDAATAAMDARRLRPRNPESFRAYKKVENARQRTLAEQADY